MARKPKTPKRVCTLSYNREINRYVLMDRHAFSDSWIVLHDGLHCGTTLEVQLSNGKWKATRIEMAEDGEWYLDGTTAKGNLNNIIVRFPVAYLTF